MIDLFTLSRRRVLTGGMSAAGVLVSAPALALLAPTPRETLGPFYPRRKPADSDIDLTRIDGHKQRARGDVISVEGRILQRSAKPVVRARVEIWQANAFGDYADHRSGKAASSDIHFQGFGAVQTDAQGRFRFHTVRPAAYDLGGNIQRTPHIHFMVRLDHGQPFATQMYFPGEPLNARDILLSEHAPEARARMMSRLINGALDKYVFDIILA